MGDDNTTAVQFEDGIAIRGTYPDPRVLSLIAGAAGKLPLVIADPPYGNIVDEEWDQVGTDDKQFAAWMLDWSKKTEALMLPGGAMYVWGGVGKPRFRPFFRWLIDVEHETGFEVSSPITWKKKRGYGIQWGYLFTREEVAYCVLGDHKKPRQFTVPLLDTKRGYAGYNAKYPAKSEFLRRSNVWDDITEILRNKTHVNQKPDRLMEIPIEIHTQPGEWVLDPFAGSGTTAFAARQLGRRFVIVEQDPIAFDKIVADLRERTAPVDMQALVESLEQE